MPTNNEIIFPQNGYAHLSHLSHRYFSFANNEITKLEKATSFNVLQYWNRRWEYPFFMHSLQSRIEKGIVLDAGAGRSLLPFWLGKNGYQVIALDVDDGSFYPSGSLKSWYEEHNKNVYSNIDFVNGNIEHLDFQNETFDAVCSMSVLEHVPNPLSAIKELFRVLKPSGILVVTVDISLDGSRQLLKKQYEEIKAYLDNICLPLYISRELDRESITTDWFLTHEPNSLPWRRVKRPIPFRLKSLIRGDFKSIKKWYQPFYSLALAGLAYKKVS